MHVISHFQCKNVTNSIRSITNSIQIKFLTKTHQQNPTKTSNQAQIQSTKQHTKLKIATDPSHFETKPINQNSYITKTKPTHQVKTHVNTEIKLNLKTCNPECMIQL